MTDASPPVPAAAVAAPVAAVAAVAAPARAAVSVAARDNGAAAIASGRDRENGAHEAAPSNGYGANGTNGANGTSGDGRDEPVGPPARYAPRVRRDYMRAGAILGRDYTRPPDEREP